MHFIEQDAQTIINQFYSHEKVDIVMKEFAYLLPIKRAPKLVLRAIISSSFKFKKRERLLGVALISSLSEKLGSQTIKDFFDEHITSLPTLDHNDIPYACKYTAFYLIHGVLIRFLSGDYFTKETLNRFNIPRDILQRLYSHYMRYIQKFKDLDNQTKSPPYKKTIKTLYATNIPFRATKEDIMQFFDTFEKSIRSIFIRSKGICFLEVDSNSVDAMLSVYNGREFWGRKIQLSLFVNK